MRDMIQTALNNQLKFKYIGLLSINGPIGTWNLKNLKLFVFQKNSSY